MIIRCKSSKRFLVNIDIENYYKEIKKMGLNLQIPLRIEIPCPKCKMIEVYDLYPNNYIHTGSYRRIDKN